MEGHTSASVLDDPAMDKRVSERRAEKVKASIGAEMIRLDASAAEPGYLYDKELGLANG